MINRPAYQLKKLIYPNRLTDNASKIVVKNAGGIGTTDWINPTNGLAEGWTKIQSPATSIVTGNGFVGNAQRCEGVTGGVTDAIAIPILEGLRHSATYRLIMKYRCSANNGGRIFWNTSVSVGFNLSYNIGNAILFDHIVTTPEDGLLGLYIYNANLSWFEVDEINITEYPLEAHYPFNGNANDESGNGLNNTVQGGLTYNDIKFINRFGSSYTDKAIKLNGTTDYLTNALNASLKAVSFWINPSANNRDIIQLSATAKISINASNEIIVTGLTNSLIKVNNQRKITAKLNANNYIYIQFDAHTCDAVQIGYSSTYYVGIIDDIKFIKREFNKPEQLAEFEVLPNNS